MSTEVQKIKSSSSFKKIKIRGLNRFIDLVLISVMKEVPGKKAFYDNKDLYILIIS